MAAKPLKSPYFVHPVVDFAMVGGISILCFTVLSLVFGEQQVPAAVALSVSLQFLINWPHFSATSFRLYRSPQNIRQYPMTAYAVPLLVLMGIISGISYPEAIAPYFIKMFMIWSPYHFSAQSLGISLLYARRCGVKFSPMMRLGLSSYIFGTYFVSTLRAETQTTNVSYYGISYPGFGVPQWAVELSQGIMILGGIVFVGYVLVWSRQNRRLFPWIILLPAIAQSFWFLYGYITPSFYVFVPMFHSLQYLLIAWMMQLKEKQLQSQIKPSVRYVYAESARWFGLNLFGGAVLFFIIPKALSALGIEAALAMGVVIAGVQIHHFIVDGVIWKLRNPSVANPLMVSLEGLFSSKTKVKAAA